MTRTGGLQNDTKRVEQKLPDARNHQMISFIKSGIRILGYVFLPFDLTIAMGVLIFSEIIGIVEELV